MLGLCSESSCSYPGRSAQRAAGDPGSVQCGNMLDDWAEVSFGLRSCHHATKDRTWNGELCPHVLIRYIESDRMSALMARHGLTFLHRGDSEWPLTVCLRVDLFWEPPGADPHAGWCGGWGAKTPRLPDSIFPFWDTETILVPTLDFMLYDFFVSHWLGF